MIIFNMLQLSSQDFYFRRPYPACTHDIQQLLPAHFEVVWGLEAVKVEHEDFAAAVSQAGYRIECQDQADDESHLAATESLQTNQRLHIGGSP